MNYELRPQDSFVDLGGDVVLVDRFVHRAPLVLDGRMDTVQMVIATEENTHYPCNVNQGTGKVGRALEVACDKCYVIEGERCHDELGNKIPFHVTRARAARWAQMLDLQV